jgi:hypothetical protein
MYVGHYAAALVARRYAPKVPMAVLFFAATLADLLWVGLMCAGVELAQISPGITAASPWNMIYNPFSHGLAANVLWAVLLGGAWALFRRDRRGGLILGALVASHWLLDLVTHRPDLPLLLGDPKVGLGLWNHRLASILVEGGLFVAALVAYLRSTPGRRWWSHLALWAFVVYCLATWLPTALGAGSGAQPPLGALLVSSLVVLGWAEAFDRGRSRASVPQSSVDGAAQPQA